MPRWSILVVVLLGGLAYAPALGNGFAFDDSLASSQTSTQGRDSMIAELHPPWTYFATQYWAGEGRESRLYRPFTIYSYALTYHLVARPLLPESWEAFPHHLINLLLNMWAVYLVFWLLCDLRLCQAATLLGAALFGVHALHSEVVAGIVGRAELLAFCFGVLGLQAWRRAEAGRPRRWLVVAGLAWFIALCSKESAVGWLAFLPCYLLARAWLDGAPSPLRAQADRLLLVGGAVLVVFLILRGIAISGHDEAVYYAANPLYHEPLAVRWLTAIKVWGYGLYKCVAPFSLACLYSLQAITLVETPLDPGFLGGLVAVVGGLAAGVWRPWRRPRLFLAVALFFGFSCITANVLFAIGTIFADRLYFIPSLGVCMLPALLLPRLSKRGRQVLVTLCVLWMGACLVVDYQRSLVWRDNQTLMLHDAEVQPRCASLQLKAATTYHWLSRTEPAARDRHLQLAWQYLRRAQDCDPGLVKAVTTEATFLGYAEQHQAASAVLRRALQMPRLGISGMEAGIRGSLGMHLIETGRVDQGLAELKQAVELGPEVLDWRLALLDHGIGKLPPGEMQQVLIAGLEQAPGDVLMQMYQADWIFTYAEINQTNAEHVVGILTAVFRSMDGRPEPEFSERLRRRFAEVRLKLARCQKALRRYDAARASLEAVLGDTQATDALKQEARAELSTLNQGK